MRLLPPLSLLVACGQAPTAPPDLPELPPPGCLAWRGPPVRVTATGDFDRRDPDVVWTGPDDLLVGFHLPASPGPYAVVSVDGHLTRRGDAHFVTVSGIESRLGLLLAQPEGAWVAWTESTGGLVARRLDARGEPVAPPTPVVSVTQDRPSGDDLAGAGTAPAHLAWAVADHAGTSSWALAPLSEDGMLLVLPELPEDAVVRELGVAGEAAWLVWRTDAPGLQVTRWTGEVWTPPAPLHPGAAADLEVAGDELLHVTWREPSSGDVLTGTWAVAGPTRPPTTLGRALGPPAQAVEEDVAAVAWAEADSIRLAAVPAQGDPCPAGAVHPPGAGRDAAPGVALRRVEGALEGAVVWERTERDGRTRIWARRFVVEPPPTAPGAEPSAAPTPGVGDEAQ